MTGRFSGKRMTASKHHLSFNKHHLSGNKPYSLGVYTLQSPTYITTNW